MTTTQPPSTTSAADALLRATLAAAGASLTATTLIAGFAAVRAVPAVVSVWLSVLPFGVFGSSVAAAVLWFDLGRPDLGAYLSWCDLRPRNGQSLPRLAAVAAAAGGRMFAVCTAITAATVWILSATGHAPSPHPLLSLLSDNLTPGVTLSVLLAATVIAPVAEEFLFRFLLFNLIATRRPAGAAAMTAALFATLHLLPAAMPALFVLSLQLQRTYRRHETLWAAIIAHSSFNLMGVALALAAAHLGA